VPAFAAFTPFATVGEEGFPKIVRVFGLGVIWISMSVKFQSVALWFLQKAERNQDKSNKARLLICLSYG
jgi:hypothetical protein